MTTNLLSAENLKLVESVLDELMNQAGEETITVRKYKVPDVFINKQWEVVGRGKWCNAKTLPEAITDYWKSKDAS